MRYELAPPHTPFFQRFRCELNCTHSAAKTGVWFIAPDGHGFYCIKARRNEQPDILVSEGERLGVNWGYLLRKGHANHVRHIHPYRGLILAASLLPVLPRLSGGPSSSASSVTSQGSGLRARAGGCLASCAGCAPAATPLAGKAAGAARGAQRLEEYGPD